MSISIGYFRSAARHASAGPYDYAEFNNEAKEVIDHVVDNINIKYHTSFDSTTAHGIEDDGCESWAYISLYDKNGDESWYLMRDFEYVVSCDDYYANQENDS